MNLNDFLKYSMDTVPNMLGQLQSHKMTQTRMGGEGADHTFRGALADAIEDSNRPHRQLEASLLRDPQQHVIIVDGRVRPGRLAHWNYNGDEYAAAVKSGVLSGEPPLEELDTDHPTEVNTRPD